MRVRAAFLVLFLAAVLGAGVASGQTQYTGGAGASVTSTSACEYNASAPCTASRYPSTITVPGGAATVNFSAPFSVTINGIQATVANEPDGTCGGTSGLAFLLQAPKGQFLEIMSFAGGYMDAVTDSSITLSSASGTAMVSGDNPDWNSGAQLTDGNLGTYAPGSWSTAPDGTTPTYDNYPSPGPGFVDASTAATNNGTATFSSVFNGGVQANGTWSLYMIGDDYAGCTASFSGWSLSFASTGTSSDTTSTTISNATANPLTKGNSVTFTASVTNTSTSATPTGTVTFTSTPYPSGSASTLCSAVSLSGSGATATATCTTSAFTAENIFEINATYTPGPGFSSSNSTTSPYYEWVNNPTTSGGTDVFCNSGTIAGTLETNMSPFPSVVTVSGISNAVQDVTVEIKDYSFGLGGADAQLMLMAPNGSSAMVLMSNLNFGESSTVTNTGSVTFTDSGAPVTGSNPFAGNGALTYAPTALSAEPAAFTQTLPATPPSGEPKLPTNAATGSYTGIGVPTSVGTATLFSTFNGVAADGTWSLFALTGDQPFSIGGWCLGIEPATGAATTTTVSGVPNPAAKGASVAITATVSSGSATPTGTVSFKDGYTDTTISGCGSVALVASGTDSATATCNVSTLAEGDHTITATYSGDTGSFNQSIGTYDQRIDDSISSPSLSGGVLTYCNTGAIQIPDPNSVEGGAAYPNPSNITVAGLFGSVNTVSVALKGFYATRPDLVTSLLAGPGGSNLDFFSGAGGDSAVSTISSILFEDGASGQVSSSLGNGPYKPTSDSGSGGAPSFPPMIFSSSPFYAVPSPINSAASNGSSTFATSFGGTAPNGNWDLFFNFHDTSEADASNSLSGWCLNLAPHVPTFVITETHSPDNFIQGSTGQITLNVNNTSAEAVTSGGSAYPVTITDVLPNGLTYASISGSANDWSCSGTTTVTCTNADVVAGGDAYGTLVLNLNVSGTATGGNNPTEVSEGAPGNFATPTGLSTADNIQIATAPTFSVTEGHSGTFTQGQSGGTLTVTVSNTAGASSTTSGTTTVTETLPTGFTTFSVSGTGWSCSGNNSITCTSTQAVAGGASFNEIDITVAVPSSAPNPTVTNAATASGGGAASSATSNTVSFPVVQVPYGMTAGSGTSPQSAAINTAFATALSVTVKDAAGNPVSGVSVTFTAPTSGASGTFSNSTNAITVPTNASGMASAGSFTANLALGGYNVAATASGLATVNFSMTNTIGAATHFTVSGPSSATAGTSFTVIVTALEAGNNTATGYTGTVHFTSTDGAATLPANSTLTNGTGAFSATLATAGNQTVTATDTVTSSITGTSNAIMVTQVSQTISFGTLANQVYGAAAFTISATASSGLIVSFTSTTTSVCAVSISTLSAKVSSATVTLAAAGQCTIQATQSGNATYAAAIPVKQSFQAIPTSLGTNAILVGSAAGSSSVIVTVGGAWAATSKAAFLHTTASGTGSGLAVFTFDAFTGTGTRTGTLTIAGFTLTVTQVGTNYGQVTTPATLVSSGLNRPHGVAVDGSGNVYIADTSNGAVKEWNAATQTVSTLVSSGLLNPSGVAVDGSGNVYIADTSNGAVKEWNASTKTVSTLVSSGLGQPWGVALDGSGNVYIADTTKNAIYEWNATTQQVTTLVSSGISGASGVAVDILGNVYIGDFGHGAIKVWNATTQQVSTLVSSGVGEPTGVAVDGSGNVYIADDYDWALMEWNAATQQVSTLAPSGSIPLFGVAVDGSGNVFTANANTNAVEELPYAFVGPASFTESAAAGSDSLLPVLPATQSLTGIFAPTSDSSWLTIGTISNGVVSFSFTANTGTIPRTANITILGQQIAVTQAATQNITFGTLADRPYGTAPFSISATASSGLLVSFASTTTSVCTVSTSTLSAGVSSATVTLAAVGQCTIQATQAGNTNYTAATPVSRSFQVTQAQPGLTLSAPAVIYGAGASVTVTVTTSLTTTPTGTVTLAVDGGTGVTKTLGGGAATFSLGILAAGIHTLGVSYSGDTDYLAISATQAAALLGNPTLTVTKAATTVTLGVNGQTVTATVSVTPPGAGTPTGSVQFLRGSTVLGTVPLSGLTASLANVTPGAVTAVYSGDADFNGSTSGALYVTSSTVTVTSSANPSALGQAVTFTANVSIVGSPSSVPTGTVQFLDGAKPLASVNLSNGQATYTTALLGGGSHNIVAQYSGDGTYPAAQASYNQMVSAVTTLALTVSPAAPALGQAVVATATVTPTTAPAGFAPPTGQVTFVLGGTAFTAGMPVGTVVLSSGTAVITLTGLVAGGNEVTAEYSGDSTWSGSSRTIVVTVAPGTNTLLATNTSVNLAVVGGQLVLSAAVTSVTPGEGIPTGSVQFVNTANNAVVATASLSNGSAVVTGASNAAAQPIEAVYSGDAYFQTSTSAALPAVTNAAAVLTAVFAPDELASLYGVTGLSGDSTATQPLPTSLGGATVTISDSAGVSRPAQLCAVFASASQINFAIPAGTATGLATLTITVPNGGTQGTVILIGTTAPGIFTANMTGQGVYAGQVVYGNPDGSQSIANAAVWDAAANQYDPNPINLGPAGEQVFLVLYGTGLRHAGALTASESGVSLPVAYFGAQSQFTGLDQVNLQVPHSLAGVGLVNLVVMVDGAPANTVTLSIE